MDFYFDKGIVYNPNRSIFLLRVLKLTQRYTYNHIIKYSTPDENSLETFLPFKRSANKITLKHIRLRMHLRV